MVTKMRIVEGFQKAKPLLTREIPQYGVSTSPKAKAGTRRKDASLEAVGKGILAEVRAKGDQALFNITRKLDGVELKSL